MTPGLSLQKLILAGLHFPSGRIGQLLDKLSDTLMNGTDVKARLDKCIKHSNLEGWMKWWGNRPAWLTCFVSWRKDTAEVQPENIQLFSSLVNTLKDNLSNT